MEERKEGVPFDLRCHADSEGNKCDFGFGLNGYGVIQDARTAQYRE